MWDHAKHQHPDDANIDPDQDFRFEVFSTFKDPLTRQLTEAVMINRAAEHKTQTDKKHKEIRVNPLNRRYECFAPRERRIIN